MANKVKQSEELPFVFTASGNYVNANFPSGTTFIHLDPTQATTQGLIASDICDLGPAPRTNLFEWRVRVSYKNTKVDDFDAELYLATSNGVYGDGGFGSGKPLPSVFNPDNLLSLGTVRCSSFTGVVQSSGKVRLTSRFVNMVAYLPSSSGIWDTSNYSYVMLTPIPPEVEV